MLNYTLSDLSEDDALRMLRFQLLVKEFVLFLETHEQFEIDNDTIFLQVFECDCEKCTYCLKSLPHFIYKPLDFKYDWYKRPGRGEEFSSKLTEQDLLEIEKYFLDYKTSLLQRSGV